VTSVAFFANGLSLGTDAAAPFAVPWPGVTAGSYTLTAVATDDIGATTTSAPVSITVLPDPNRFNVALAVNGGVATASSTLSANYPASATINGDRRGLNWGSGGGWNDGTQNAGPDWLEVTFNGPKTIDEVNVFSMQDNFSSPSEPTPTMTFISFGVRAFDVQYWTGSAWAVVPNGAITNNNLVWRQVTFPALTTTRIRIFITQALNGYSRLMEVEAWGSAGAGNTPPAVSLVAPADGSTFTAPATIALEAAATDADGTIGSVEFFANGASVGISTVAPFAVTWSGVSEGSYVLTAVATDNLGVSATSTPVSIVVSTDQPSERTNVALASNGGVATASSTLSANYPASAVTNGDRRGTSWGAGGGWNDGTLNAGPDWIEVAFDGLKTIDEVNVFSLQDNYSAPSEPTPTMTFVSFGLRAFEVQFWNGTAWITIPGASVVNNNLVWRQFTFAPITTTRIRVFITGALNGYARAIEVEAWGRN
jgi:hypothetical protein